MDPRAGTLYGARLQVRGRLPKRLLVSLVFIRNVILGATALHGDHVAPAVVEVFRLSDGVVVGVIPIGSSYYDQVDRLAVVQHDLQTKSRTEFLSAWGLSDS